MNEEIIKALASPASLTWDSSGLSAANVIVRFLASTVLGFIIGWIFRTSHGSSKSQSDHAMFTTLVLLTILICMVTTVVGNSVARAFSLAGALAIVRFRTDVDDTRDTAFVVFAVVVGMAVGCEYWLVPAFGIPTVFFASWLLSSDFLSDKKSSSKQSPHTARLANLRIRSALGVNLSELIPATLMEFTETFRCTEVETAKQGAAVEANYQLHLRPDADLVQLINQLNRLEGVQSASVQSAIAASR